MASGAVLPLLLQRLVQQANGGQRPMSEQAPGVGVSAGVPQLPAPRMSPAMENQQLAMQNQARVFGQEPNLTAGSMRGPSQAPTPVRASDVGPTEWNTKGGRAMAITQASVESFSNAFKAGEQKNWQRQASQAEQLWQSYSALSQALAETQDPKAKAAIQQQLDTMMQDKNTQKILKKAHTDPTSAYGVGIQRAMQQSKQEAADQAKLEQMYSEIQKNQATAGAEQARAKQETATAALRDKQTEQAGQVTPSKQAEIQSKKDIVDAQIKQQQDRLTAWAKAESDRTNAMIQIARIRASALKNAKGNDQLIKYFQQQYNGLERQFSEVNKQIKDANDNLAKVGVTTDWFTSKGDKIRESIPALQQRSQQLQRQMQDINNRLAQVTQAGALQMPDMQQDATPGVSTPPEGNITVPQDTIVVKPEDMQ